MTIFGRVVRWLRGRPVWAGNRYDPGDTMEPLKGIIRSCFKLGFGIVVERGNLILWNL